jgi:hypothetical protein
MIGDEPPSLIGDEPPSHAGDNAIEIMLSVA